MLKLVLPAVLALAAAAPAHAACRAELGPDLPIVMDGNQPLVRGEINGKPMLALVDTGATVSLVWRGAAARYGLPVRRLRGVTLMGVDGQKEAESTTVRELKLGKQSSRNLDLVMAGADRPLGRSDIAMIIGQDILSKSDVEFDFGRGVMRFIKSVDCGPDDSLAYWGEPYSMAPIEPVSLRQTDLAAPVLLNGRRIRAVLDTGAYTSVVTLSAAAIAGLQPGRPGVEESGETTGMVGRGVRSYLARFQSLQLGDQTVNRPKLRIADLFGRSRQARTGSSIRGEASNTDMLIGADFFRSHRVLVAYSQRRMYFTHRGGPVFQTEGPPLAEAGAEAP